MELIPWLIGATVGVLLGVGFAIIVEVMMRRRQYKKDMEERRLKAIEEDIKRLHNKVYGINPADVFSE